MSIAFNRIYISDSSGELSELEEIRINRDQVIEMLMNKLYLLNFLATKLYTYNKLLAMEYYRYIQLLATPIGRKIQIYPLIYDYFGVDLSDTTYYPTIFTGVERIVEYIDWLKKSKAEYLIDYRKWLVSMKLGVRVRTFIKQIIFVFNDIAPELISYLDSINIGREIKINVLIIKKYQYGENNELINIAYYPWSY